MTHPPEFSQPLSLQELDDLDELLLSLGERLDEEAGEEVGCILTVSELDGFLTAIASAPALLPPSQWLPAVWGGALPTFATQEEGKAVMSLLLRHYNTVNETLRENPDNFSMLLQYHEVDGKEYEIVDEWCLGYLRGVSVSPEIWVPVIQRETQLFAVLRLFGSDEGWQEQETFTPAQLDELRESLSDVVWMIYLRAREQEAGAMPYRREQTKAGRNDPCPCGSGKKYKHCCLQ